MPKSTIADEPAAAWAVAATRRLVRYLRCLRCPRDRVDDFAQEALLAAARAFAGGEPPLPWLLTAARNAWLAHCRAQRPEVVLELDALHARAVRELGDDGGDSRLAALRLCLAELPPRSLLALQLCYRDALSRAAAAKRLGLGVEGLRSLLARLRAGLKECVERRRNRDE